MLLYSSSMATELTVSSKAIDKIIYYEVTGEAAYNQLYKHPEYPGGASGVTIGIGYDIGYHTEAEMLRDWSSHLPIDSLHTLARYAGVQGQHAHDTIPKVKHIEVPFDAAKKVFMERSMRKAARELVNTFHGAELLRPDAAGGLLSLVFNRGCKTKDEPEDTKQRRKEMRALLPLVAAKDYAGMSAQIRSMKRLWPNMNGLRLRRDWEALMMLTGMERAQYSEAQLVHIAL